jgi:hypothetical protein
VKRAPWTTPTASPARLTADEHKAAKTTAFALQLNPANPGMSLPKLDRARDKLFWSVRISDDVRGLRQPGCAITGANRTSGR